MIARLATYLSTVPAVFIDGLIYILLALTAANGAFLGSDNAAKYISPQVLFYLQWSNDGGGAMLLALKMFRSTAFAEHQKSKETESDKIKLP